jgi:hypothetical protein
MVDEKDERWHVGKIAGWARYLDKRSQKERDFGKMVDEWDERWQMAWRKDGRQRTGIWTKGHKKKGITESW